MQSEHVLVVRTEYLKELLSFSGIKKIPLDILKKQVEKYGEFLPRELAENDERYRQLIPYIVLKDGKDFVLLKRTKKQGEKRLHNKFTIGIGGHINSEDGDHKNLWTTFEKGLQREFREEVDAKLKTLKYLGVINDLTTEVSRVHLGILYIAEVHFNGLNERDMFQVYRVKKEELHDFIWQMEGWSRLTVRYILRP
ncbi:NUDIX domain-containing protein [Kosmotoga pacifica]|uniref:NUDIX domain-containing protein n=1 Tax=Kosmotoga pacifica TaxID=1330330 RepID=UPI000AE3B898|nr:NUDIX domain-containing protein [Kosmotoga pacifica]